MPRTQQPPRRPRSQSSGILAFITQAITNYHTTGAVAPSSAALARAMTQSLRTHAGPKRILEVGPGTGPFTRAMLAALKPGDELHVVEINPAFAERLDHSMLEPFRRENPDITVELHCQAIETADVVGPFDFVVCGLPFNNFPPALVRSIFRRMIALLKTGGELAYFEYAAVRIMKGSFVGTEGRKKLGKIRAVGKILQKRHRGTRTLVLSNFPPAVAVKLHG
ncbi:MAG TPA: methyltransferase domain-containing protein [Phycisphaerales bacterium]|nr:methyltransferase domain-containing protein [Phycisphaerales bacterium]